MSIPLFTIGTDPEFPLKSHITDRWRSAIPVIKGTKKRPIKLPNGGLLQHDNVALEFATPPAVSEDDFVKKIKQTFDLARKHLPADIKIESVPAVYFPKISLKHPEAKEFGCDPDFNAYTNDVNKINKTVHPQLRTFGGHVHIGATKHTGWLKNPTYTNEFVKFLDTTLGFASVILDNTEEGKLRKALYGKAGCYRRPEHGIEYRTLSNFWFKSEKLVRLIYRLVYDTVNYYTKYTVLNILHTIMYGNTYYYNIFNIINNGITDAASEWLIAYKKGNIITHNTWELFNECREFQPATIEEEWDLQKAA